MKNKIISRMEKIVAETMHNFQFDFTKYDQPYIETATHENFPMIWVVGESHTYLLKLGEYKHWFYENEAVRWAYLRGDNTFDSYLNVSKTDRIFLITDEDVAEINKSQAQEAIRDYVNEAVQSYITEIGPLPKYMGMPIKLNNISFGKLKELVADCRKHKDDSLMNCLKRFRQYGRSATDQYIEVSYNPGYNEFGFAQITNGKVGLVGGVIFHGWPDTGYQTNGSVQIDPHYGWSVHT